MAAYRYVVFPPGKQPTVDEVRALEGFAGLLANHFAWGVARNDGRLALACEAASFDHARQIDAGFDALVCKWEVRGSEVMGHLGFVKDAAAVRPVRAATSGMPSRARGAAPSSAAAASAPTRDMHARPVELVAAKRLVAHEAVAQSLMSVDRTLERFAALQRLAAVLPYVLMAAAAVATLAVGLYVRGRLVDGGPERRQETIERVLEEPRAAPRDDAGKHVVTRPAA